MSKNKFKSDSRFAILIEDNNNESKDNNKPKESNNKPKESNNKPKESNNKSKEINNKPNDGNRSNDNNRQKESNRSNDSNNLREENDLNSNEENIFKNINKPKKLTNVSQTDNIDLQEKEKARKEEEKERRERVKRKEDENAQKVLSMVNFPELIVQEPVITNEDNNYISFLDKIKLEKIENEEKPGDTEFDNLEIGWQLIKRDLKTGITTVKYKSNRKNLSKTDLNLGYDVINTLAYIHGKRTQAYIDKWGEDEWNEMFKFPNYDYEYFDKLDELYEDELDENSQSEVDERNNEDYDNAMYNSE
jgi:hypothetical protein